MLGLALPVLAENLLAMFVGWSDSILTGRILAEERYLAAVGASGYLLWLIESCATVISYGAQAIVARLVGSDRISDANRTVVQSLILGVGLGVLMLLLVFDQAETAVTWLNLESDAKALAVQYLHIIAYCCPFMMMMLVGTTCLRAAGHTFAGMIIMTTVNIVNIVASWLLTVGFGPISALGWKGIAAGTSTSFVVGGLLTVAWLLRGYRNIRIPFETPKPDTSVFARILRIGIPGAMNSVGMVVCQLWFISIIGKLGNTAMAAHIVAIRCESLGWLAADAFAIAAATLVGQSLGAQRVDLARLYGWLSFLLGCLCVCAWGVCMFLGARLMFSLFVVPSEADVIRLGIPLLRLVSFAMPALAACTIFTGAVRGAGDTRWPLIYTTGGMLLVRLPLAYLLVDYVGLGVYGAWLAMFADLYARGIASAARYLAAGWTRIEV